MPLAKDKPLASEAEALGKAASHMVSFAKGPGEARGRKAEEASRAGGEAARLGADDFGRRRGSGGMKRKAEVPRIEARLDLGGMPLESLLTPAYLRGLIERALAWEAKKKAAEKAA